MRKQTVYVIGALHAGRTQLIHSLVYGTFGNTETQTGQSVARNVPKHGAVQFDFVETSSENDAMTIRSETPRVLVYDVHDASSISLLNKFAVGGKTIVVAAKSDDVSLAQGSQAFQTASNDVVAPINCPHLTISAKTNSHIGDLWEHLISISFPDTVSTSTSVKVKTIEELKSYWDAFSRSFADNLAMSTSVSGVNMLGYMKMQQAHNILEIACGSGMLARFALHDFVSPTAHYTATDLSANMLEIAKQTLGGLDSSRVAFKEANGEQLPFENETFDRVIANYVLHLTETPVKMLQEVHRVMKPGGVAGFSMWGRAENSPQFTLNNVALKKLGVELKQTSRSSFHLNDITKTTEMVKSAAGFSRVVAWYSTSPFDIWSAEEYRKRTEGTETTKMMLKDLTPEQVELFWRYSGEEIDRMHQDGAILRHEALIVVAFK